MANCERFVRASTLEGSIVSDTATRRELERCVRKVVPVTPLIDVDDPADAALTGVGGLLVGYVWGFVRGRRTRKRSRRGRR